MFDSFNHFVDLWIVGACVTLVVLLIVPRLLGEKTGPSCSHLIAGLMIWPLYYVILWGMWREHRHRRRRSQGAPPETPESDEGGPVDRET